jgi:predicted nucleic acid-binding Zn ribbon protein
MTRAYRTTYCAVCGSVVAAHSKTCSRECAAELRFRTHARQRLVDLTRRHGRCWIFAGDHDADGYGSLRIGKLDYRTDRLSWELHYGSVPPGLVVYHSCDNRACWRPEHLFLGVADPAVEGHVTERVTPHRPSLQEIVEIRADRQRGITYRALSEKYHLSESALRGIVQRKHYQEV